MGYQVLSWYHAHDNNRVRSPSLARLDFGRLVQRFRRRFPAPWPLDQSARANHEPCPATFSSGLPAPISSFAETFFEPCSSHHPDRLKAAWVKVWLVHHRLFLIWQERQSRGQGSLPVMLAQDESLTRMAKMKSPLHDIPPEHRDGQTNRTARVAELLNCHLWPSRVLKHWQMGKCRAGIAGDGLLILGIRARPRALGVMICKAARTACAYLRACLLPVDRTTRVPAPCRCTPEGSGMFEHRSVHAGCSMAL